MSKTPKHQQKRLDYISSFLRNYRLNCGLRQKDLSNSSLSHRTVLRAEAAKNISLLKLFEILDAMELDAKELFMDVD